MITVRAGPMISAIAGPDLPDPHHVEHDVQQLAVQPASRSAPSTSGRSRTRERRRSRRTGAAPAVLGDRHRHEPPPAPISPPDISSVSTYSVTQAPMTSGTNPKSAPSWRSTGAEAPEPGIRAAAHVALVVAHADERPAATDRRPNRWFCAETRTSCTRESVSSSSPSAFGRMFAARIVFRSRMLDGVTSTSSSSLMNSIACSRPSLRGGIRRMASSARRRAHVRLLLFLRDVDVHVGRPRVLADDHALRRPASPDR